MKAIILAAGQGSRLRPITNEVPKCMVPLNGTPLIDTTIKRFREIGISDIVVVGGYKYEVLKEHLRPFGVKVYFAENYDKSNMVATLFSCEKELNDDVIVSYSDIIYTAENLKKLVDCEAQIATVVDKDWRNLWQFRMDNPLDDAESLVLSAQNNVLELGKKTKDYAKIQAQYIGLSKFSKDVLPQIVDFYRSMDQTADYDGKNYPNMYMTTFLQRLIDSGKPIKGVIIRGGWLEVDTTEDLHKYERNNFYNGVF